jgi:excisionase family DNA binding protein
VDETSLVVTVQEAANLLGISRGLAYQLVREGVVPSIRLGRRLVIPRRPLIELVQGDHYPTKIVGQHKGLA